MRSCNRPRAGRRWAFAPVVVASLLLIVAASGCVHVPPPAYQASIDNTEVLLRSRGAMRVGVFDAAPGVDDVSLGLRGSTLKGGGEDGRFSSYLREALVRELQVAGRFDATGATEVTGTLVGNDVDIGGSRAGMARVGARFVVRRDGKIVYDRVLDARDHWEGSFLGAIAIPQGMQRYSATVQLLLRALFTDPDFQAAVAG